MTTRARYDIGEFHEHVTRAGNLLHPDDQKHVLRRFVHRYTGNHKPDWVNSNRMIKRAMPVQFKDDAEWLANTQFRVRDDGRLDKRVSYCMSNPTWPYNPELRGGHGFKDTP